MQNCACEFSSLYKLVMCNKNLRSFENDYGRSFALTNREQLQLALVALVQYAHRVKHVSALDRRVARYRLTVSLRVNKWVELDRYLFQYNVQQIQYLLELRVLLVHVLLANSAVRQEFAVNWQWDKINKRLDEFDRVYKRVVGMKVLHKCQLGCFEITPILCRFTTGMRVMKLSLNNDCFVQR